MKIKILKEEGYNEALLGISLSRNQPLENMPHVAEILHNKDGGHNKFLESISVWLDITAPRYWWQQEATYRIGTTTQSESTMYTILKRELVQEDFENPISSIILTEINKMIKEGNFEDVKNNLPEGFLQRRIICTNYKTLRNMILQRKNHKLSQWKYFCNHLLENLEHKDLLL
jgi:hypothetical protein